MIKLYGMPLSNYYSMVRHALLEKGVEIEYIDCPPVQEPGFLGKSPMGKVPMIETPEGFLTESNVIMEYLEDVYPQPALMPTDVFGKAKARQLMKIVELYVEAPVHPLVGLILGRDVPDYIRQNARPQAERGLGALSRLAKLSPWMCGEQFTFADVFCFYSFALCRRLGLMQYDWDMLDSIPGLKDWYARMEARPATAEVMAGMMAAADALAARQKG